MTLFLSSGLGGKNLLVLHRIFETPQDLFLQFELGGKSLGKLISEMKGDFFKGERIYRISHSEFYKNMRESPFLFKSLAREILKSLEVLHAARIIHSDLKPENILLKLNQKKSRIQECKLIDFGSMIPVDASWCCLQITTPEYMPPEILESSSRGKIGEKYKNCIWSLDVWSFGTMLLEIISGVPVWINMKCKVERKGKLVDSQGLFASKGRNLPKIAFLQKQLVNDLKCKVGQYCFDWMDKELFLSFLGDALALNPLKRKSPEQLLAHPFLTETTPY